MIILDGHNLIGRLPGMSLDDPDDEEKLRSGDYGEGLRSCAYDVVLSNKSGFCHGVKVRSDAWHIDYCLTPTRYVWMPDSYLQREGFGRAVEWGMKPLVAWLVPLCLHQPSTQMRRLPPTPFLASSSAS